jgi:hypothetical protein
MKYEKEVLDFIVEEYLKEPTLDTINALAEKFEAPPKSLIAKLSSLGIYKKKEYLNKRGEPPIKKEVYLARIAELLQVQIEQIESLEKVNKNVLILLEKALAE